MGSKRVDSKKMDIFFKSADRNKDGVLTKDEVGSRLIRKADYDKDGQVSRDEYAAWMSGAGPADKVRHKKGKNSKGKNRKDTKADIPGKSNLPLPDSKNLKPGAVQATGAPVSIAPPAARTEISAPRVEDLTRQAKDLLARLGNLGPEAQSELAKPQNLEIANLALNRGTQILKPVDSGVQYGQYGPMPYLVRGPQGQIVDPEIVASKRQGPGNMTTPTSHQISALYGARVRIGDEYFNIAKSGDVYSDRGERIGFVQATPFGGLANVYSADDPKKPIGSFAADPKSGALLIRDFQSPDGNPRPILLEGAAQNIPPASANSGGRPNILGRTVTVAGMGAFKVGNSGEITQDGKAIGRLEGDYVVSPSGEKFKVDWTKVAPTD